MHHNNTHTENNNEECFIVISDDGDSISTGTLHSVGGTVVSVGVTVGVTEKTTEGVGLSSHREKSMGRTSIPDPDPDPLPSPWS